MKELFIKFLRSENMLQEFEHNFKAHGFRDQSFDEFLDTTEPEMYTFSAFQWSKTSRCENSQKIGQMFWNNLSISWHDYRVKPAPKTSDRQKIKSAIERYFAALNVGETFYGSILAEYCLDKAKCKNKYPATVFRYMRQMREADPPIIKFECTDKPTSKYIKL